MVRAVCQIFIHLHCFLLASETKIPQWRWQRMMIFMLANTISCIVTSVLLNIVDHRQVRYLTHCLFVYVLRVYIVS